MGKWHVSKCTDSFIGSLRDECLLENRFWEQTIKNTTAVSQKRFIQNMDDYLESVVHESINKKDYHILDIKSCVDARRRTSAARPTFSLIELELDIPDEVMAHPAIQEMIVAATDMAALSNVSDIHEKILRS